MILHVLSLTVAILLLAFTARRVLFLLAAIRPISRFTYHRERPSGQSLWDASRFTLHRERPSGQFLWDASQADRPASILALLPCRNEAHSLPALLSAIETLDYPRDRLKVVVVDDGSTDDTAQVARAWADGKEWARVLSLPSNVGKAAALNEALARFPNGDLIAVYDSDSLPAPDSLLTLSHVFDDPQVGAANGFLLPLNSVASPAAYYSTVELFVHQRITMAAKDRLNLAPAILGSNCLCRRTALAAVGNFRPGLLLEDSDLTLSLTREGYRTRFVPAAIAFTSVPQTLSGYWRQHVRWSRGFQQVVGLQGGAVWRDARLPIGLRLELLAFALGYADRLALLGAAALTALDLIWPGLAGFPPWLWLIYFGFPFIQIIAALALAPRKSPARMYLYLVVVPFFFAFDLAMAVGSIAQTALRRPAQWTATERPLANASKW